MSIGIFFLGDTVDNHLVTNKGTVGDRYSGGLSRSIW